MAWRGVVLRCHNQTFACDTLDELDTSFLRADYSLLCNTHEHNMYKIYASVMILVSCCTYV